MTEYGVDPKVEIQMKALVEQLSAYIETFHGGSAEYVSFDGKILKVHLGGSCLGCPLSPATLHGWVEGTVRQFFPGVEKVESV
ncbi:MAG TPA: NifU family protein [Anaerolineales bacterium]